MKPKSNGAALAALYNSTRWKQLRSIQLRAHPLCQCPHCQEGTVRVRIANVVDHTVPHRGCPDLFFRKDNLMSMAKPCHDRHKQSQERGGLALRFAGVFQHADRTKHVPTANRRDDVSYGSGEVAVA